MKVEELACPGEIRNNIISEWAHGMHAPSSSLPTIGYYDYVCTIIFSPSLSCRSTALAQRSSGSSMTPVYMMKISSFSAMTSSTTSSVSDASICSRSNSSLYSLVKKSPSIHKYNYGPWHINFHN